MKKFLLYILIIMSVVLLGSSSKVFASYGTCWIGGTVYGKSPSITPDECTSTGSFGCSMLGNCHAKGVWQEDGQPAPPPPDGPQDGTPAYNLGTCWLRGTAIGSYPNMIPTECAGQGGSWQGEGQPLPGAPNGPASGTVPPGGPIIGQPPPAPNTGPQTPTTDTYHLLAPLGNVSPDFNPTDDNALGKYLNDMIQVLIGLCAVMSVIMIVVGGTEYMTSELVTNKEHGKERILGAIFGLTLAIGSWLILNTINPAILNTNLGSLSKVTVSQNDFGAFSNTPSSPIQSNALQALGITDCTGSGGKASVATVAQEFIGKTNYSMTNRNTISGSTINLDCTSFVDQVYNCTGLTPPAITSGNITSVATSSNGQKIDGATFDFSTLHPGDMVGWEGNGTNPYGHVAIYIGNGQLIDTNSHGNTQIIPVSQYKDRITFVRWP